MRFVCAHCGAFATSPELDFIDSGTTLTCTECGGQTVVDLDTPEKRTSRYALATMGARTALVQEAQAMGMYDVPQPPGPISKSLQRRVEAQIRGEERAKQLELIVRACLMAWAVPLGYEPGLSTWVEAATTKAKAIADKLLAEP